MVVNTRSRAIPQALAVSPKLSASVRRAFLRPVLRAMPEHLRDRKARILPRRGGRPAIGFVWGVRHGVLR